MFTIDLGIKTPDKYNMSKFMPFPYLYFDCLDSFFLTKLKELPVKGTFTVVARYRPDLAAYAIYRDVSHKQILMVYNELLSEEDFTIGRVLSYPDINDVEDLYYSLQAKGGK